MNALSTASANTPTLTPSEAASKIHIPQLRLELHREVNSLNARSVMDLRSAISQACADGPVLVLLDGSGVVEVTPAGVAAVIDLMRYTRTRGGDLRLHSDVGVIADACDQLGLRSILRLFPSVAHARGLVVQAPVAARRWGLRSRKAA